jgi:hypothetical protein
MGTTYVDPDSAAGVTDGTTNGLTANGHQAYASLALAEAALPATATSVCEIICESNGPSHTADTTAVDFSGTATSASNYIYVHTSSAARHVGVWSASNYRIDVAGTNCIGLLNDYITFDGIQAGTNTLTGTGVVIRGSTALTSGANQINISNVIARCASAASFNSFGFTCGGANINMNVWNCIIYGAGIPSGGTATNGVCLRVSGTSATLNAYSVTAITTNGTGINRTTGTLVAKNCYASGPSGFAYNGTITKTTCASSDTTGTVGLQSIALSTANFVNVTSGSENLHLVSGSALIDVGTTTSGAAAPLNFTTDIDLQTRTGTWDIGADEYKLARKRVIVTQ